MSLGPFADFQLPGPLDYSPEFKQVLSSAPEWSMPGRDERVQSESLVVSVVSVSVKVRKGLRDV